MLVLYYSPLRKIRKIIFIIIISLQPLILLRLDL